MAKFLAVAAVLAWLFGTALLVAPAGFYAPTGIVVTPMMATIAQVVLGSLFARFLVRRREQPA
jgi:hypothetical protein